MLIPASHWVDSPAWALVAGIINPQRVLALDPAAQSLWVRRARRAALLGVFDRRLQRAGLFAAAPRALQEHCLAGRRLAADFQRMLELEVRELGRALADLDLPMVLLKGAAYRARGLEIADGRVAADVDLLLPAGDLAAAEQRLLATGWQADKTDDYDQQYYRQWMHELPPLRHRLRLSVVDLHHNILPPTCRHSPPTEALWARVQSLPGTPFNTLGAEDLVLHNCAHLFIDGELDNRVRELVDLDGLLRAGCAGEADFLVRLQDRADELGLSPALAYGLSLAADFPGSVVDAGSRRWARRSTPGRWSRPGWLALMRRVLAPELSEESVRGRRLAVGLLYLRSHWLRMPPGLLLRHLWHQSRRRGGLKRGGAA